MKNKLWYERHYAPWGQNPNILSSKQEKSLFFIKEQKCHIFLECIGKEIIERFSPNGPNKNILEKFLLFLENFHPKENFKINHFWKESGKGSEVIPPFEKNFESELLDQTISLLMPWRKGPFFFMEKK